MSNWYTLYIHIVLILLFVVSLYSLHILIQLNQKSKTKTKNYGTQKNKKAKHLLHEQRWNQNVIPGLNDKKENNG